MTVQNYRGTGLYSDPQAAHNRQEALKQLAPHGPIGDIDAELHRYTNRSARMYKLVARGSPEARRQGLVMSQHYERQLGYINVITDLDVYASSWIKSVPYLDEERPVAAELAAIWPLSGPSLLAQGRSYRD